MITISGVQHAQRVQHRRHHMLEPGFIVAARWVVLQNLAQRLALAILHHHVGGAVLLPEAVNANQRVVLELRQNARLFQKALQPGIESALVLFKARFDEAFRVPIGDRAGQVFLDGHHALQLVVMGQVDDREAAFADHVDDLELTQPRMHRQAQGRNNARPGMRTRAMAGLAAMSSTRTCTCAAISTGAWSSTGRANVFSGFLHHVYLLLVACTALSFRYQPWFYP